MGQSSQQYIKEGTTFKLGIKELGQRSESLRDPLQSQKLKVFCLDNQQSRTHICRDSKTHTEDTFRPIDESDGEELQILEAIVVQTEA